MQDVDKPINPLQAIHQAEANFGPEELPVNPIDSVEDMLELAETVQVARTYLAERYHEIHPEPGDMPKEHHGRIMHHGRFLREVGKISTRDWQHIGLSDEAEDDPATIERLAIALNNVEPRYVSSLTRPDWDEYFPDPKNLEETLPKWQEFKAQFPEDMQVMLDELHDGTRRLQAAQENSDLFAAFQERKDQRFDVLMSASCVRSLERSARDMYERADRLRRTIPEGVPAKTVLAKAEELERRGRHFEAQAGQFFVSGKQEDAQGNERPVLDSAIAAELARRSRLDDRRELRHGLLVTEDMERLVSDFLPQALAGKPILLVGETGGAKTAAAEYLAQEVNKQLGKDPNAYEFISGYGQMNSYQLMGKDTIKTDEHGGSYTEFAYGAVTRAMKAGSPVILDEANATDPTDIQKRFNKILQLKPGQVFQIQEDGGERITVQPGFCIIMTANEKSARYKSTHDMSADFKNRFAANVGRVSYPDVDVLPGQAPQTLLRLAQAVVIDRYGNMPTDNPALDAATVIKFVSSCHRLQRMFTIPLEDLNASEKAGLDATVVRQSGSGDTALKMETISPRMMVAILDDLVAGGRSGLTLPDVLNRYVEGITDVRDREIIRQTLAADELISKQR